jgi:putative MATE family efflux protein
MRETKNITDMTTGSTMGHIIRFTLPLLVGNLFQQFYTIVNSLIVGNYVGSNALAAVGACAAMSFLFFSLSSGLAMGTGIIVAQFYGAKDEIRVKETIANSIYVLVAASVTVSIIGICFAPALLRLLQTPPTIINDSIIYLRTTCCGIIAIALYNGVASILRALGDSKTPLYFLIFSCIINVILDVIFVLYFNWSVFGVAFSTVISQVLSAILSILYAYKKVPYFHLTRDDLQPNKQLILHSIRLGLPVAFQNSMIAISMLVLQGVVNSFGETVVAAYTIASRVEQLAQLPFMSLGTALTNFSGQNIGSNQIERVKKGFIQSSLVITAFSLLLIPIAYLFGTTIIGFFVKDQDVISIGAHALCITSLFYSALGMIHMPRAVLNGCGDTAFSMINGFTEVACRIVYSNIFTKISFIGYWGIWITTGVTWVTIAIICILRYLSGKWKYKKVTN